MGITIWQRIRQHQLATREFRQIERRLSQIEDAVMPKATGSQLDDMVIDNEEVFYWRFGFRWPLAARVTLMNLKQKYKLTDWEIKRLYYFGNLRRRFSNIHIHASRTTAVIGFLQVTYYLVIIAYITKLTLQQTHHSIRAVMATLFVSFLIAVCVFTYISYIFPWRVKGRAIPDETETY